MPVMDTISDQAKIVFGTNMDKRVQQSNARLKPYVKVVPMKGKAMTYDGVGTLELQELNGRFSDIVYTDFEFWRRKVGRREFGAAVPIDDNDIEERLMDPESNIVDAMIMAFNRKFDKVVSEAMFADVMTGEDMTTAITYANDGGATVTATGGLTYDKFLEINQNFIDNDVTNEGMVKVCVGITGTEHTDLMGELELTSGDYSRQYVVDGGYIQRAVGIELVRFAANAPEPILPVVAGVRTSFAMAENAMVVGLSRDYKIEIEKVTGKYHTKQVVITGVLGATRTQGKLIQKVTTTA